MRLGRRFTFQQDNNLIAYPKIKWKGSDQSIIMFYDGQVRVQTFITET